MISKIPFLPPPAPLDDCLSEIMKSQLQAPLVFRVQVPGFDVPVSLKCFSRPERAAHGRPIVFCFHGAVNRDKTITPVFEGGFLRGLPVRGAWIIGIADPLLDRYENLRTSWYAGSETCNVPLMLKQLIEIVVLRLQASRVIFAAGSTGGHAALVQSWQLPDSIAIVSNPILTISDYYRGHVTDFRRLCWPSLGEGCSWPEHFIDAVSDLYSRRFDNNVIYLNNARDHHFWLQAVGFLNTVREGDARTRLMFISQFYSQYAGHRTPPQELGRWVMAACDAKTCSVLEVAMKAEELAMVSSTSMAVASKTPLSGGYGRHVAAVREPSSTDLAIARRLLDSLN